MSTIEKGFKVKANDFVFDFSAKEIDAMDIVGNNPNEFNILYNNESSNAKVISVDPTGKKLKVEVNGETFDIEIKDELDQMLEVMGFGSGSTKHLKEIKAPMPGLVLDISVLEGQKVKEGDRILILEAMKMENSIMIHSDAKIKKIGVRPGQAVEKGQVLVELE